MQVVFVIKFTMSPIPQNAWWYEGYKGLQSRSFFHKGVNRWIITDFTPLLVHLVSTGKTTFLAKQVEKIVEQGLKPLVCSLTKTAAAEIAGRDLPMDPNMVGTLHSLAYRSIGHHHKLASTKLWNQEHPQFALSFDFKNNNRNDTDDLLNNAYKATGDTLYQKYDLYRHRCKPRELWPISIREFAERWEEWKFENEVIDFTDMIDHAIKYSDRPIGDPDIVIGDELQDFSRLEYNLLKKWGDQAGALIGCGDGWQSLYTWRGSDPTIFYDDQVPDDHRRVLKQSYRVPINIQRVAVQWVQQLSDYQPIEYAPREEPGSVSFCQANRKYPDQAINLAEDCLDAGKSVMLIASCEYMLRPTVKTLRDRGIPFANPWRPVNGAWNPLARRKGTTMPDRIEALLRMDASQGEVRPWTVQEFADWTSILTADTLFIRGGKKRLDDIVSEERIPLESPWSDVADCVDTDKLIEIGKLLQAGRTDDALEWWLKRIQGSKIDKAIYPVNVVEKHGLSILTEQPRLYVGTIHSFKGGEADVVIIYPDLSPQAFSEWMKGDVHRDPIVRAYYVALTRARERVYLCQPVSEMCVNVGLN